MTILHAQWMILRNLPRPLKQRDCILPTMQRRIPAVIYPFNRQARMHFFIREINSGNHRSGFRKM